jgi:hypothetical protein
VRAHQVMAIAGTPIEARLHSILPEREKVAGLCERQRSTPRRMRDSELARSVEFAASPSPVAFAASRRPLLPLPSRERTVKFSAPVAFLHQSM